MATIHVNPRKCYPEVKGLLKSFHWYLVWWSDEAPSVVLMVESIGNDDYECVLVDGKMVKAVRRNQFIKDLGIVVKVPRG